VSRPRVCIVGAGPSGLTALQVLRRRGIAATCFEQGPAVGGQWRYENESGTSSTFASLTMMSSRPRSGLRRFPIPRSTQLFPLLHEMQEYFEDFARTYDLFDDIRFEREVVSVGGGPGELDVTTGDGETSRFDAVIVASGHHSRPRWPALPDGFAGTRSHSADYRTPERFAGRRVVVVGCGASALEIAVDVCDVARSTIVAARSGGHLIPKRIGPMPLDLLDNPAMSRVPFPLQQRMLGNMLWMLRQTPRRNGLPKPDHGLLQRIPITAEHFGRRVREGAIDVRPGIVGLDGPVVRFADGSSTEADHLLCSTGYEVRHPFLPDLALDMRGRPLYRRIVHPDRPGVFFAGLVDPNGGLLPLLEGQCEWIADVLAGRLALPSRPAMEAEMAREAERIARRFVAPVGPSTWLLCDRWPYVRQLRADRRRRALA
jgi:hypothetical protein